MRVFNLDPDTELPLCLRKLPRCAQKVWKKICSYFSSYKTKVVQIEEKIATPDPNGNKDVKNVKEDLPEKKESELTFIYKLCF